jgi:xylulokinase
MTITTKHPGWAEQTPAVWWENVIAATSLLKKNTSCDLTLVKAIGLSYQMHGLVIVDSALKVLRDAIIWCDSRAIETGRKIEDKLGKVKCFESLLNLPGNFTLSKLKWVQENEPEIFSRVHKAMLPGDYIAMMLTGEVSTTVSGLSEAVLWNYRQQQPAREVLEACAITNDILPKIVPTFGLQGKLTKQAAKTLGLRPDVSVTYRIGDQPNNAFSLNVLNPGDVATTAGTSGVVYAVGDQPLFDEQSRVNTFVHVNHTLEKPRYGTLMCINGCGIAYSWIKATACLAMSYQAMNAQAAETPPGAEGLIVLPYGNGAERTLGNITAGASFINFDFNIHGKSHLLRAVQEGIVFAFNLGFDIMKLMGIQPRKLKAGHANLFLSPVFQEAFVNTLGVPLELYETDGSQGAARGAGVGAGIYSSIEEAFIGLNKITERDPTPALMTRYRDIYGHWSKALAQRLAGLAEETK